MQFNYVYHNYFMFGTRTIDPTASRIGHPVPLSSPLFSCSSSGHWRRPASAVAFAAETITSSGDSKVELEKRWGWFWLILDCLGVFGQSYSTDPRCAWYILMNWPGNWRWVALRLPTVPTAQGHHHHLGEPLWHFRSKLHRRLPAPAEFLCSDFRTGCWDRDNYCRCLLQGFSIGHGKAKGKRRLGVWKYLELEWILAWCLLMWDM